jgi:hypothetical protein
VLSLAVTPIGIKLTAAISSIRISWL